MDDCQVCLPKDTYVSRHHFTLEVNPPDARIRDLGSMHRTHINGQKYGGREKHETPESGARRQYYQVNLHDGDEIKVGKSSSASAHGDGSKPSRASALPALWQAVKMGVGPARHGDYDCEACREQAQAGPVELLLELFQVVRPQGRVGVNLPDYQIGQMLGKGGMGGV